MERISEGYDPVEPEYVLDTVVNLRGERKWSSSMEKDAGVDA